MNFLINNSIKEVLVMLIKNNLFYKYNNIPKSNIVTLPLNS